MRKGKSAREAAEQRVIPIARALLDDLAPFLGDDPDGPLIRRRSDYQGSTHNQQWRTLREAWERATKAGEARQEAWFPRGRRYARGDHAFRAGFQAALVAGGIRDEVIDALVGHAPKTTRARHYVDEEALWGAMREAVDEHVTPIDWQGPEAADELEAAGGEVVQFRR